MTRIAKTSRLLAGPVLLAAGLAACSEPPYEPVSPYAPAPYYRPIPSSRGGYAYPNPGRPPAWPSVPQPGDDAYAPPSAPAVEGPAWTEPPPVAAPAPVPAPAPTPSPEASPAAPAAPAEQPAAPSTSSRFDALRSSLERAVPVPPAAASPSGCTTVRQRSGFHDHYGGLNSAGDVLQTCAPPAR